MLKTSRRNWPGLFHFRREDHYRWWKKSCTTSCLLNPMKNWVQDSFHQQYHPNGISTSFQVTRCMAPLCSLDIFDYFRNKASWFITPEKRTNDNGKFQPWRCISKTKMEIFPACHLSFWGLYCWWLKSCTTWNAWNPINNGINYHIDWCRISSINSIHLSTCFVDPLFC